MSTLVPYYVIIIYRFARRISISLADGRAIIINDIIGLQPQQLLKGSVSKRLFITMNGLRPQQLYKIQYIGIPTLSVFQVVRPKEYDNYLKTL